MTMTTDFQYSFGDSSVCSNRFGSHWIPVVLDKYVEEDDQYFWLDDRPSQNKSLATNPKWPISQPNSMGMDECVLLHGEGDETYWNDQNCKNTVACSTCKMKVAQTYYLRGPKLYDQKFTLSVEGQREDEFSRSRIVFEGQGTSEIIWSLLEKKTLLLRKDNNMSTMEFDQNPFGLLSKGKRKYGRKKIEGHKWIFTNVSLQKIVPNNI